MFRKTTLGGGQRGGGAGAGGIAQIRIIVTQIREFIPRLTKIRFWTTTWPWEL